MQPGRIGGACPIIIDAVQPAPVMLLRLRRRFLHVRLVILRPIGIDPVQRVPLGFITGYQSFHARTLSGALGPLEPGLEVPFPSGIASTAELATSTNAAREEDSDLDPVAPGAVAVDANKPSGPGDSPNVEPNH